jgi:hypothetical protein
MVYSNNPHKQLPFKGILFLNAPQKWWIGILGFMALGLPWFTTLSTFFHGVLYIGIWIFMGSGIRVGELETHAEPRLKYLHVT